MRGTFGPALAALVLGCTTSPPGAVDAAVPDAPDAEIGSPVVQVQSSGSPPDWRCLRTAAAPTPGPEADVAVHVQLFPAGEPRAQACVHAYAGDPIPSDTCAATDPQTDANGVATVRVPMAAPFVLRVYGTQGEVASDTFPELLAHVVTPEMPFASALTEATWNGIALHAGLGMADRTRAVIGAGLVDCSFRQVTNVVVRLARGDGTEIPLSGDGARRLYGDGTGFFATAQSWARNEGTVAFVDVPVEGAASRVWLEMFGRRTEDSALELLGCTPTWVMPGVVSVNAITPLAADASCPVLP